MDKETIQDEDALTIAYMYGVRDASKRIKELEAENKRLRSAALEVVSWDWRELQRHPDHIDWIAAPRSIDELEKALESE